MGAEDKVSRRIGIFVFCDALGFEIVSRHRFMEKELPFRRPLGMQFGYSSAAVPTFLSGKTPAEHGHFSFFYFDREKKSPFRFFRYLQFLLHPRFVFNHHRVRNRINAVLRKILGYTGYFNLYGVPFERLPYFDYCEKTDMYAPGGLEVCPNIHDVLLESGLRFHLSDWRRSDDFNLSEAAELAASGEYDFLFVYTGSLDGMLHFHVGDFEYEEKMLAGYREKLLPVLEAARGAYDKVDFCLFSDHGMTPLAGTVDVRGRIEALPYRFGKDYIACYDSTMCRLYFLDPACREPLMASLSTLPGHWLTSDEKRSWGVDFARDRYGEEIFLLDPGLQALPNDMGDKAIPGMHGFHPDDKDSTACFLSPGAPELAPEHLRNVFDLMVREIEILKEQN